MVFLVCKLEADLPISPLRNLRKVRRGFLVIDEVGIMMLYGKRVSKRKSDEVNIWTENDSDCRSARVQQEYSTESVPSEEKVQLHFFCLLIYSLDIDVETSLYLLHCWTVFHCHHDFIIAVPSTSTNVLKSQHILEFNGAKLSTEGQNRNNDMESFWARTMWYKTLDYLLPYAKGFEMNNVQTEPKHQIYEQLCHW